MDQLTHREPLLTTAWCEEVAARYRDRDGVHVASDLASDMFHAVAVLFAQGVDRDRLADMFRTRREIIVTTLHAHRSLIPEVLVLTHSTIPLDERLLISDARFVVSIEKSKQLQAAQNLIATNRRRRIQLKARRRKETV